MGCIYYFRHELTADIDAHMSKHMKIDVVVLFLNKESVSGRFVALGLRRN